MHPEGAVETRLRVRYAETDAMGVVYHANYFIWFEAGRGECFRVCGQDYVKWEEQGYFLPVSEAHARYHAPARYGDLVVVHTWLKEVHSRSVTLGYQVSHETTQRRLVSGWTKHICMDREGQARRLPQDMLRILEESEEQSP
ncbi:MAG: thioesterase family protein [Anaerolineae bacterium]|jgi:acyl-CoA thioester hydrolase